MREAAAEFEQSDIAGLRRTSDLRGIAHQAIEVPLGVTVQMPVPRVEWHLDSGDHASRLEYFGEQHQAIGASAFDAPHMVIRCTQPSLGLGDDTGAAGHTAVSGVGI